MLQKEIETNITIDLMDDSESIYRRISPVRVKPPEHCEIDSNGNLTVFENAFYDPQRNYSDNDNKKGQKLSFFREGYFEFLELLNRFQNEQFIKLIVKEVRSIKLEINTNLSFDVLYSPHSNEFGKAHCHTECNVRMTQKEYRSFRIILAELASKYGFQNGILN